MDKMKTGWTGLAYAESGKTIRDKSIWCYPKKFGFGCAGVGHFRANVG